MKRSKKIYVLLGVLVVSGIATFCVSRFTEQKEQIKNSDKIIMEISDDSVQSLSWECESGSFAFHKDKKWLYDEDKKFPVDEKKIEKLLKPFHKFGVSFVIEKVKDFGQYGLDDPTCTINLKTEKKSYKILLGNYSNMDSERYVSIGDGNVYLVKNDPLDQYDITLKDMIDHDDTPSFEKASEIKFSGEQSYHIVYDENSDDTYSDDDVYFKKQDGGNLPLDTSRVDEYLNEITGLRLEDYVTYNATEEELKKYGLDSPDLSVTVNYTAQEDEKETDRSFALDISREPEEKAAAERLAEKGKGDPENEEITAYARVGNSKIVYRISSDSYQSLMDASYNSLRHQEVFWADFEDVKKIEVTLEGEKYTITSKETKDGRVYYYQDEELKIGDLKDTLGSLKAKSFTDKQPSNKEEIHLEVSLDNDKHPEIQIALYRYNGKECLASVDGEPVSLIKRSDAVDLVEAVHAIVLR